MIFNRHLELEGKHAFMSASQSAWTNYDIEKMAIAYRTRLAAALGTRLHEFARQAILLKQRLPNTPKTMNMYVNDAIGFRMTPEVVLVASDEGFGTADTLSFRKEPKHTRPVLRIHDLKTGVNEAPFRQLEVYAAYFCIEYGIKPMDIDIVLRIYQNDKFKELIPDLDDIVRIIDKVESFTELIKELRAEAYE